MRDAFGMPGSHMIRSRGQNADRPAIGRRRRLAVDRRRDHQAAAVVQINQPAPRVRIAGLSAQGHEGVDGDEALVFGVESDSKVLAWQRQGGQPSWTQEALRFRGLSAPTVFGRSVVVGDDNGLLHFLSRQDGQVMQRVSTDGSAITGKPFLVGQNLVVVTRTGGIFGFRPE